MGCKRLTLIQKILNERMGIIAAAEHIHNNVRVQKEWVHRLAVAELLFEPRLQLLA